MNHGRRYLPEQILLWAAMVLTPTGFWNIYFAPNADPTQLHHAHVLTISIWLSMLLYQLKLVRENRYQDHRKVGLAVLILAPLLVATAALLSVHSAHSSFESAELCMVRCF
jgi:peptidoglycan biosynthesis protein MviN/MurJ (putative lipid II flippase)